VELIALNDAGYTALLRDGLVIRFH